MEFARESASDGSRYGQHSLGKLLEDDNDDAQALLQYLAEAQGLYDAQCQLGRMHKCPGCGTPSLFNMVKASQPSPG